MKIFGVIITILQVRYSHQLSNYMWGWFDSPSTFHDTKSYGRLYYEHNPQAAWPYYRLPAEIEDSDVTIPDPHFHSPDFRLPEEPWVAPFYPGKNYPKKDWLLHHRPYLISPVHHALWGTTALYARGHHEGQIDFYNAGLDANTWGRSRDGIENVFHLACFCCTVYKRLTPLATCAVLTVKHILTTASSTELVLRRHPKKNQLESILGAWYHIPDSCKGKPNNPSAGAKNQGRVQNCYNSSTYAVPSRIHYHPRWVPPDRTNRSHPLPSTMDFALWATTYPMHERVQTCMRGVSRKEFTTPVPQLGELYIAVGYQFVWDIQRKPMPWYMYGVKVRLYGDLVYPCPKVEWGWFFCIQSRSWAQLGMDSGGGLYLINEFGMADHWRMSGLAALNAFSMKLRSEHMIHYYQPVDTHQVLNWLYSAYNGRLIYRWLDGRFNDTQWGSPKPKPWAKIIWGLIWSDDLTWPPDMTSDQHNAMPDNIPW